MGSFKRRPWEDYWEENLTLTISSINELWNRYAQKFTMATPTEHRVRVMCLVLDYCYRHGGIDRDQSEYDAMRKKYKDGDPLTEEETRFLSIIFPFDYFECIGGKSEMIEVLNEKLKLYTYDSYSRFVRDVVEASKKETNDMYTPEKYEEDDGTPFGG